MIWLLTLECVFFPSFFVDSPHLELKPLKLKAQGPKGQDFPFWPYEDNAKKWCFVFLVEKLKERD